MPLQRQIIELPFFQGLDTKTDAKQIPLGKLLVLQNAVFTAPGKLQKRNGYTALTTNILGGGTISSGAALFTRANELCMTDTGRNLYSYDSSNTAWHNVGKMPSVTSTTAPLANPQYTVYGPDVAVASNGLQCCVYELYDYNGTSSQKKGIGYTIIDSTTGQVVVPPSTLDATATSVSPKVVVFGTSFVCYYIQGDLAATAGIYGKTLDSTAPLPGWSAATQLTSGVAASAHVIAAGAYQFDAISVSGNSAIYLSFNNRSGGTTVFRCLSALAVTTTISIAATTSRMSTLVADTSGDIAVAYLPIGSVQCQAAVYSADLGTTRRAAAAVAGNLDSPMTVTGCSTGTNSITLFVGYSTAVAGLGNTTTIRTITLSTATYTNGTLSVLARSVSPGGKAFTYSSAAYVPVWFGPNVATLGLTRYQSPQNGLYLLDSSGNVLAKSLIGSAGCFDTVGSTSTSYYQLGASTVSSNTVTLPATSSNILLQTTTGIPSLPTTLLNYQFGAIACSFNFSDTTNNYLRGQLANAVHTNGGVLQMYDGQNVCEHGFLTYPFTVQMVNSTAAGALTALGVYQYAVTYEWMDGQGQLHRSTPSAIRNDTLAGTENTVTVSVPTLRLTAKTGVMVQIYRTVAGGTTFYQITNFNASGSLFNDKTVDVVSWVDTQADTAITGNPQLYTTGDVLENAPCAPAGPMTVHRNRLFVVDSTNPTQIWYSKVVSPPSPVEFSGFQVMNVDPKGGAITALASLDDKLIIFKSDRIFMVLGQGPDALGGQNDFTDAILVSSDTGCSVPKSVVVVPDGIMFQGPKGIYLLTRALQVFLKGEPATWAIPGPLGLIGPYQPTTNIVKFAILHPATQRVLFGHANAGGALMYDQLTGQWSTLNSTTITGIIDAVASLNSYYTGAYGTYVMNSSGAVYAEIPSDSHDAGVAFSMTVTTGWIKLSGLQGLQRVWRLLVLGEYVDQHTLTVTVAYDYKSGTTQTFAFAVAADPNPYQFRCHLAQQKCEAIQITITDSAPFGTSMSLSGLALEVGMKKGPYKLPASKSG